MGVSREYMDEAIVEFHRKGGVLLGTCAGLILFATEVGSPAQRSLGLIDVTVDRNAFGRQIDSFVDHGRLELGDRSLESEMVFIRAPRIRRVGPGVRVLGVWGDEPVLVREGRVFGATFHPELRPDSPFPSWFVAEVNRIRNSVSTRSDSSDRGTWTGSASPYGLRAPFARDPL